MAWNNAIWIGLFVLTAVIFVAALVQSSRIGKPPLL
jgi:hypothetical protein